MYLYRWFPVCSSIRCTVFAIPFETYATGHNNMVSFIHEAHDCCNIITICRGRPYSPGRWCDPHLMRAEWPWYSDRVRRRVWRTDYEEEDRCYYCKVSLKLWRIMYQLLSIETSAQAPAHPFFWSLMGLFKPITAKVAWVQGIEDSFRKNRCWKIFLSLDLWARDILKLFDSVERGEISDASAVDGSRIPIRPTPNGD